MSKKGKGGGVSDPYFGWENNLSNARKSAYNYGINQMKANGLLDSDYNPYTTVEDKNNIIGYKNQYGDTVNRRRYKGKLNRGPLTPIYGTTTSQNADNSDVADFLDYLNASTSALSRGSDFSGLLGTNAFDKWYNDKSSNLRKEQKGILKNLYGNVGEKNWADTSDDDILNSILDTQYNNALNSVEAQKNRGFLDDVGYNNALSSLDTQKSAGNSQLQSLGGSVLSGYKDELSNKVSGFYNDLDDLNYGDSGLDTTNYDSIINALLSNQQNSLSNDIANKTSGLSLFDVSDIINNAALTQGQQNLKTTDLLSALEAQKNKKSDYRGLGDITLT